RAVGLHAHDRRVALVFTFADVARRPDGYVEHAVRPEADELPAMSPVMGKAVVHDDRLWRVVQMVFNIVKAQDAVRRGHVERAFTTPPPFGSFSPPLVGIVLVVLFFWVGDSGGGGFAGGGGAEKQAPGGPKLF